jgi:hypothetical protein
MPEVKDPQTKDALVDYILSNITKLANSASKADQRQLIMLVAAISLLNVGDSPKILSAARRVAQLSMIKSK